MVCTIRGADDSRRLWIMSHLDVVPEGDRSQWRTDPFVATVKDGRVYGRGVEDNQQGVVSSILTALAFVEAGVVPDRTIKLLFVADEEVGSKHGIQYLLDTTDLFRHGDFIVIPDGGKPDGLEIEVAEKNICWLKVTTKGEQCHASVPDEGANAFLAACEAAIAINALETAVFVARDSLFSPDRSTLSPTKKDPNVPNINTIPGDDVFYVDMRMLPAYSIERAVAEVRGAVAPIAKRHGVDIMCEAVQSVESKATPRDAPVVAALAEAIGSVYGGMAKPVGIGGGTVGAYLRNEGFDCVVWSRVEETAHQPNENAILANVLGDAKVFAALANG
jgi:succinyl-diaminopimelate desuccinylase